MAKILWVDDEVELLKPHIFFLQNKGYDVDTCNNGYDAIDMVRSTAYDLIILDEMMPGMTGLETLPLIKDVRPTTPVIMVTKSEEEHLMDKAIGSKIADYIIKPVNPIRSCFRLRRMYISSNSSPSRPRPTIEPSLAVYRLCVRVPTRLRRGVRSIVRLQAGR